MYNLYRLAGQACWGSSSLAVTESLVVNQALQRYNFCNIDLESAQRGRPMAIE